MALRQLPVRLGFCAWGFGLLMLPAPRACWGAEGEVDVAQLVAKVDPAVVTIKLPDGNGSGFLIDEQGILVTNYHVIEGAKEATAIFLDKTAVKIEGFVAVSAGKDIALLRIQPGGRKLQALRLAEAKPAKGEKVYAFGAPLGLSGSVSDGLVSAVRAGEDMRDTLKSATGREIYVDVLGYDLDADWIQTTAPISPGNSGGPLVNSRGEVVGINSWRQPFGQNLNFAVCSIHIKQLMGNSGMSLRPLADLPRPRHPSSSSSGSGVVGGEGKKTLDYWTKVLEMRVDFERSIAGHAAQLKEIAEAASRAPPMPPIPRRSPSFRPPPVPRGKAAARLAELPALFTSSAKAYSEFSRQIKNLPMMGVDPQAVLYGIAEADLAFRFSLTFQSLAAACASASLFDVNLVSRSMNELNERMADLHTARDLVRLELANRYKQEFPSLQTVAAARRQREGEQQESQAAETAASEPTEERPRAASSGESSDRERRASEALAGAKIYLDSGDKERAKEWLQRVVAKYPETKAAKEARALLAENDPARAPADPAAKKPRTWTDRSGRYQIQAVFLAFEEGKVLLRKTEDGSPLTIPMEKLSEADQRLIRQWTGTPEK